MTRYHRPQTELAYEAVGNVFDSDFGADEAQAEILDRQFKKLLEPLEQDSGFRVEELDCVGIRGALSCFVLQMRALPSRPKSQLAGTLGKIARNPKRFLAMSEAYEPEAAALVLNEYAKSSAANRQIWLAWELGQGPGPAPEEIMTAAKRVREVLKAQIKSGQKRGRPKQVHVTELAIRLSRLFIGAGGSLKRLPKRREGGETGPFHRFLKIVLEPVKPVARRVDVVFTITTMVQKAIAAQKKQAQPELDTMCPEQDAPPLNTAT